MRRRDRGPELESAGQDDRPRCSSFGRRSSNPTLPLDAGGVDLEVTAGLYLISFGMTERDLGNAQLFLLHTRILNIKHLAMRTLDSPNQD